MIKTEDSNHKDLVSIWLPINGDKGKNTASPE